MRSFPKKIVRDQSALELINYYFEKGFRACGIEGIDMLMRIDGIIMNHKKIRRIKKQYHLVTEIRRKNPYRQMTLKSGEHASVKNLLNRDFYPLFPDEVYSTDMTYLYYGKSERAYLSATKDLATNEIISYKMMKTPTVAAFVDEFKTVIDRVPKEQRKKLMIHSDQGFQYTHESFRKLLQETGVTQSMSRRGNCLDNAPIESFFGHLKDLLNLKDCISFEDVENEVNRKINYYNHVRPQKALNKKPPAVYRGLLSGFL